MDGHQDPPGADPRLGAAPCCPEVLSKHSLIISSLASPVGARGEPWLAWGKGHSGDLAAGPPGSLGAGGWVAPVGVAAGAAARETWGQEASRLSELKANT